MRNRVRRLAQAAIIAALYTIATYLQNILLPGSASWPIQCRLSDALCVLALFTPAAVPGLGIGTLIFNLSFAGALPLDWLLGSLATVLGASAMRRLRSIQVWGYPLPAMLMPALANGLLIGGELALYTGFPFSLASLYVALGELAALLLPGTLLWLLIRRRNLHARLFG